jgi:hypothetical protein
MIEAERIPAAIAKAEGALAAHDAGGFVATGGVFFTRTEVALAKELWSYYSDRFVGVEGHPDECSGCAALRAFVTKVEGL